MNAMIRVKDNCKTLNVSCAVQYMFQYVHLSKSKGKH